MKSKKIKDVKPASLLLDNYGLAIFQSPLQMEWRPKEDITAHELALCLPHFFGYYKPDEIDVSLPHFRHFKITDPNKDKY